MKAEKKQCGNIGVVDGNEVFTPTEKGDVAKIPEFPEDGAPIRKPITIIDDGAKKCPPAPTECPKDCLGDNGNVDAQQCDNYECSACGKELWERNCKGVIPVCTEDDDNMKDTPADPTVFEWKLYFRQTAPTYLHKDQWRQWNTENPQGPNYSILGRLDDSAKGNDGKFEFKIVWPQRDGQNFNHWRQSSNPMNRDTGVIGYESMNTTFEEKYWGGLEYNANEYSLLDGSVSHSNWFYAIGSSQEWGGAIPGPDDNAVSVVELWAFVPVSKTDKPTDVPQVDPQTQVPWQLVFRQTAGTYLTKSQWKSWNIENPEGDNYSVLSRLNELRTAGGAFEFMLKWPQMTGENYQVWRQTSNPLDSEEIEGFECLNCHFSTMAWNGLSLCSSANALLDGTSVDANWNYAVGSTVEWEGGIPGAGTTGEQQVELFVRHATGIQNQVQDKLPWQLIFRQTAGTYLTKDQWRQWNTMNPDAPNFSRLSSLSEAMKSQDGKYEFKMVWPNLAGDNFNTWRQSSNPVARSQSGVEGFEALHCNFHAEDWGGLEYNTGHYSLLDGSVDINHWWYAVGSTEVYGEKYIPGPGVLADQVELYVRAAEIPAPTESQGDWQLLFKQTAGTYLTKSQWRLWNTDCSEGDNYSLLADLKDSLKVDGSFEFKMVWPQKQGPNTQHWKQSSNPMTAPGSVEGFECLDCAFGANMWGGLEMNEGATSLIDGSVDHSNWYYAIASTQEWEGAIPGPDGPEQQVELYLKTHTTLNTHSHVDERPWNLVFRQTAGTYLAKSEWQNHNAEDPTSENYSILNRIHDAMKGADGKFEFMIVWPNRPGQDKFNRWKQSSNPMTKTSGGVEGFECLDCWFGSNGFGGLEFNTGRYSVLDGTVNHGNWFYAIGATEEWNGAIPGAADAEQVVELYIRYTPEDIPAEEETFQLLFRQTAPTFLAISQWKQWNTCNAEMENYSILSKLTDSMRMADGKFHFKLVWPQVTELENTNEWKQTSNPAIRTNSLSGGGVEGYESINTPNSGYNWAGLENNEVYGRSVMDGSVNTEWWWYAVGSTAQYGIGIPGPVGGTDQGIVTTQVELYVKALPSMMPNMAAPAPGWRLMFRQTYPQMGDKAFWYNLNAGQPDADNYSILSQLDDCSRGSDGKFQFMIKWPLRAGTNTNIWKQTNNPMQQIPVAGYEDVSVNFNTNYWGGLEYNTQNDYCLIDGSVGHNNWYYAIGASQEWGGAIPGPDATAERVIELYVFQA